MSAVDTASFAVLATIPVGLRPRGISFSKDGSTAFVTNELGGTVTVIDVQRNQPVSTIKIESAVPLGQRPMNSVLSADGAKLFVSTGRGGAVAVIGLLPNAVFQSI